MTANQPPRNLSGNLILRSPYTHVMMWPSTVVGENNIIAFHRYMLKEFSTRAVYLEEIVTGSSVIQGRRDYSTTGRNDVFFAIHEDDVRSPHAPRRLASGMRWLQDILISESRKDQSMYPARIAEYVEQMRHLHI